MSRSHSVPALYPHEHHLIDQHEIEWRTIVDVRERCLNSSGLVNFDGGVQRVQDLRETITRERTVIDT